MLLSFAQNCDDNGEVLINEALINERNEWRSLDFDTATTGSAIMT